MHKIIFTFLSIILSAPLLNASAAGSGKADAERAARIAANRQALSDNLRKSVEKVKAQQKQLRFLPKDALNNVLVDLTPSELKALNEQLKSKKEIPSPCPIAQIIGLAPFKAILDTFGQNGPSLQLAKQKGGYLFEGAKFAIGQPVLVPHDGNNRYGVIIDEIVVADGPLKTVTYKYRAQIGSYTDKTTDSELARLVTQELEPQLIGYKIAKAAAPAHTNANSLLPSPQTAAQNKAIALAASASAQVLKKNAESAQNPNSLEKPAAAAANAQGAAPASAPTSAAKRAPFVPKLKRYQRGKFAAGTIIRLKHVAQPVLPAALAVNAGNAAH